MTYLARTLYYRLLSFYSASVLLAMQTAVIVRGDLSVCPSHSGVLSRQMKIRSCGFQRQVVIILVLER